jgi:hypothetical protein
LSSVLLNSGSVERLAKEPQPRWPRLAAPPAARWWHKSC